jgi:hypothetical protein
MPWTVSVRPVVLESTVAFVLASIACTSSGTAGIAGIALDICLAYSEAGMIANVLWASSIRVISCLMASISMVMPPEIVRTLLPLM